MIKRGDRSGVEPFNECPLIFRYQYSIKFSAGVILHYN